MRKPFAKRLADTALALASAGLCVLLAPAAARAKIGCHVLVYADGDLSGEHENVTEYLGFVGPHWDHRISSFRVIDGQWEFFGEIGFRGDAIFYGDGSYAHVPSDWNARIRSMRCHAGTNGTAGLNPGFPLGPPSLKDMLDEANRQIGYSYGHLMLQKDLDRAEEIRRKFPSLAAKVDVLVASQAEIKAESQREDREYRVENEARQRDEDEKRERQRRDPSQHGDEQWKRLQTEAGLVPHECGSAESEDKALFGPPWTEKIAQATALREGGRSQAACTIFSEIKRQTDKVRDDYAVCNRKITGIYTFFTRQGMYDSFLRALKIRMEVLEKVRCQ